MNISSVKVGRGNMAGGRQETLLMKFTMLFNYSTFISDSIRCENVEVIRITRAKVEFG